MLGSGDNTGQLALTLDDGAGAFAAKRRKDGRYEITITSAAAQGRFSTTFPPFERPAQLVPNNGGPPFVTFAVPREFLEAA